MIFVRQNSFLFEETKVVLIFFSPLSCFLLGQKLFSSLTKQKLPGGWENKEINLFIRTQKVYLISIK